MEAQENNNEKGIDLVYLEIISPENYKNFGSVKEFIRHLKKGTKADLECILIEYEKEDMYEQCTIIKDFIEKTFNNQKNK